ncbi:hypothetical protein ACFW04_004131 [Cataglyphis niger]
MCFQSIRRNEKLSHAFCPTIHHKYFQSLAVNAVAVELKILFGGGGSGGAAGGLKFTVADTCERIKEEFNFIQQQYHSLKLECEKLASEKTEMQRHYVMYYEMSYGLNVEMHKQVSLSR